MKKITAVTVMSLAMVIVITFTCYAETYYGCYQKSSGQLRVLTDKKDTCRQTEKGPIQLGGDIPEVPIICAGYVDCYTNAPTCVFTTPSSCISSVNYLDFGQYQINFTKELQSPICVFYLYPLDAEGNPITLNQLWVDYFPKTTLSMEIDIYSNIENGFRIDVPFNFICTQP
jgi:hypothetical protein